MSDRRQETGDRRQKAEDRRQETVDSRPFNRQAQHKLLKDIRIKNQMENYVLFISS